MEQTAKQLEARPVDAEELMKALRREIEENSATVRVQPFFPLKPKRGNAAPLSSSEDLLELNLAYPKFLTVPEFSSHRPIIGRIIVLVKRATIGVFWKRVVLPCLQRERDFVGRLLRFLNFSAQGVDQKFGEVFWDLIRKIDIDIQGVNERLDRTAAELDGTVRSIERGLSARLGESSHQVAVLNGRLDGVQGEVATLDNVARGLERTLHLATAASKEGSYQPRELKPLETEYLLLENRFRGSEEQIRASLTEYLPLFEGVSKPVLDIGCGRGELLELFRERGIPGRGLDIDRAMVLRCQEKGLEVVHADLFEYLAGCSENSLGGVIATQVVEHLTQPELRRMVELIKRAVVPGGKVVLETINPQSVAALSRNFFRDPTHVFPVHPETLRFSLEMLGLRTTEILYRSPYPEGAKLQPIPYEPELPVRWRGVLQRMNDNVTRLNDLLFGYQDYAVIAEVQ